MKQRFSVIFDMDGTLLDTQRIYEPAWEYAGRKQGISGMGSCIKDVCGTNEAGCRVYLAKNFPNLDVLKFREDMYNYVAENEVIKTKNGANELVGFLKQNGIRMGVASGTRDKLVGKKLSIVGLLDNFECVVGGDSVKNGKPAPDIFLLAAERMGVAPENCFVFEDSPNGIRAAYAAGMKCIGVPDTVDFSDDITELLFAKLERIDEAIPIFKEYLTEL